MRRTSSAAVAPPSAKTFCHCAIRRNTCSATCTTFSDNRRAISHRAPCGRPTAKITRGCVSNAATTRCVNGLIRCRVNSASPRQFLRQGEHRHFFAAAPRTNFRPTWSTVPQTKNSRPVRKFGNVSCPCFRTGSFTVKQRAEKFRAARRQHCESATRRPGAHVRRRIRLADENVSSSAHRTVAVCQRAMENFSGTFSKPYTCDERRGYSGSCANSVLWIGLPVTKYCAVRIVRPSDGLAGSSNARSSLSCLHHRLDFRRHLSAQNGIHFFVNPLRARPRATFSPPPPRASPLPRLHERESVSTQTRSACRWACRQRFPHANRGANPPRQFGCAGKSSAITPIIFNSNLYRIDAANFSESLFVHLCG